MIFDHRSLRGIGDVRIGGRRRFFALVQSAKKARRRPILSSTMHNGIAYPVHAAEPSTSDCKPLS